MSKSQKPGSGGVAADKTARGVEGKLHSPTVAVSLIVNDQRNQLLRRMSRKRVSPVTSKTS